jgi:hypothetical protein
MVMKRWICLFALILFCLAPCCSPATGHADDTLAPTVLATNPSNGATGVSRALPIVSISFSEPMGSGIDLAYDFEPVSFSWSPDQKTFT